MRVSIYSMIRLTALLTIFATFTGVAAHRLTPSNLQRWRLDHKQPWTVSNHVYNPLENRNLVLDLAKGRELAVEVEPGTRLDLISVSPFATKAGERELVCRQYAAKTDGQDHLPGAIELVRMSFPASEVIETRQIDWLPNSPPAWDPVTANGLRTIFATGAGQLVRMDWTNNRGLPTGHRGEVIQWHTEAPFGDKTFIGEPAWATGPLLANHLLVSIWGIDKATGQYQTGLAALQLNPDRSGIVSYNMICQKSFKKSSQGVTYRFPVSRTNAAGRTRLAWQERADGEKGWNTFVADLTATGQGYLPVLENRRLAAKGCMSSQVAFDEHLNYLYFVVSKTDDCYDGAYWRKARLSDPALFVAAAQRPRP